MFNHPRSISLKSQESSANFVITSSRSFLYVRLISPPWSVEHQNNNHPDICSTTTHWCIRPRRRRCPRSPRGRRRAGRGRRRGTCSSAPSGWAPPAAWGCASTAPGGPGTCPGGRRRGSGRYGSEGGEFRSDWITSVWFIWDTACPYVSY